MIRSEADQAFGGVCAIARFIPNPDLLVMPYLSLEAVFSARIEGTHTTLSQVFETEAQVGIAPDPQTQEVINYLNAMKLGLHRVTEKQMLLSLRLVQDLHAELLKGVRGANAAPGRWRNLQVHIGPGPRVEDAYFIPPPAQYLGDLLDNWEKFLHEDARLPVLVKCAILHAQFEMIHPFFDGNGRIGRLLISLFLIARGGLPQPLLFLSPYLEHHRDEYYDRLLAVSAHGDWQGWVSFFLRAVAAQSRQAVAAADSIVELQSRTREQLQEQGAPGKVLALADLFLRRPVMTIRQAAEQIDVTFPTASKYVHILVDMEFLQETTGRATNQVFMAVPLLKAIEGSALPPEDMVQAPTGLELP